jgi:threonine aldolase
MYYFTNDYSEGAHEKILQALIQSNLQQEAGYGLDSHTANAVQKIRDAVENQDVDVHLLPGGTQTNLTAIGSFLRPHEACIAAESGHIATHETGAIEATGHKVITVPSGDGKIRPAQIQEVVDWHKDEHSVKPRLVYISNSTEVGTIYNRKELLDIRQTCDRNNLLLYIDGARLGAAIVVEEAKIDLALHCKVADAFTIGATKNGALLGEAIIIRNETLKEDFRYLIKQRGALMAKGRILGIQFEVLFTDDLYFDLARHAKNMADHLTGGLRSKGLTFLVDSPTNQVFPILSKDQIQKLEADFAFSEWEAVGDQIAIRLVTSWATSHKAVDNFLAAIG